MDANDLLFSAISDMSGGLITDIQTLLIAAVVLSFLLMGIDQLKTAFDHILDQRSKDRAFDKAVDAYAAMDSYDKRSVEYKREELRYKRWLEKSI